MVKSTNGVVHRPLQHVVDRVSLNLDVQDFSLESGAPTGFARDEYIGQEDHLDLELAGAVAYLTAATLGVERESGRAVAPGTSQRLTREQLANLIEGLDVGNRVGAGSASDGRLI